MNGDMLKVFGLAGPLHSDECSLQELSAMLGALEEVVVVNNVYILIFFHSNGRPSKGNVVSKITKPHSLTNLTTHKIVDHDAVMKTRPLRNALAEYVQSHKTEFNELKIQIKKLTNENETLQMTIRENQESTKTLKKTIDNKTQVIMKYRKGEAQRKQDNESLRTKFDNLNEKLCALEVLYDKNITELGKENTTQKRRIELLEITQNKLTEEFNANRKDLQTKLAEKTAEFTALQEQFLAAGVELMQSKEQAISLQDALEACELKNANDLKEAEQKVMQDYEGKIKNLKLEIQQKNEIIAQTGREKEELEKSKNEKIKNLKLEIQQKNEIIAQTGREKEELEKNKNQTIDELSYKIREIERVFGQPFTRVERFAGPKTSAKTAPVQQTNQVSTQHFASVISNAATTLQRQANVIRNALPEIHATTQSTAAHNRRNLCAINDASSDDDASSDYDAASISRGWRPNLSSQQGTEATPQSVGFGPRKRSQSVLTVTSESDNVNQNIKRSKESHN